MRTHRFRLSVTLLLSAAAFVSARPMAAQSMPAQFESLRVTPGQVAAPANASSQSTQVLTLQDAEKIAIQNHPHLQAAAYLASAAQSRVSEVKSLYYPQAFGSVTGAYAENSTRIGAGALNNPTVFN